VNGEESKPADHAMNPSSRGRFGRFVALARPELGLLLVGTFFLAIGSATGLATPQAIRLIIDGVTSGADRARVDRAALLMFAIFVVQGAAFAVRYTCFTIAGDRTVTRLRKDLFSRILAQEIAFFDARKTGELTSRLGTDTSVLQSAVSVNLSMALRHIATIAGGLVLLAFTSPVLTALMLAVVPAVAIGARFYGRRVRAMSRDVQDALAAANEVAEESIAAIRTVRSFGAEPAEQDRYALAVGRSYDLAKRRTKTTGTFIGGAAISAYGAMALVLWYGGRLVLAGSMTVGALTSFLLYTLFVAFALGALGDLWGDFMRASGAGERIFGLLDRIPSIPSEGGDRPASAAGALSFEGVRFTYPTRSDVPVLHGIDFSIASGEVVAIVGPSGAGKSTLGSLVGRLYDPDAGRVTFDGRDLRDLDPAWLRAQIGVVAQEPVLFSCSIADNIRLGTPGASDEAVEAAARAANAHDFVTGFPEGYGTTVGERGIQLSGGQKQRVAIARALLKNPRVLLLDEATSALDAESEHLVKEALDRLMRGRTTLVIAHRMSTVLGADRVLVLENGRVVQSGAHDALVREDGVYRRLVERQLVAGKALEPAS